LDGAVKVHGLMIWLRRSLVLGPVLAFVAAALLWSCGGGSSSTTPGTPPFALFSLAICSGPLATITPTPVPTNSTTPKKTATPMCSPLPTVFVSPTSVPVNGFQFNVQGQVAATKTSKKLYRDFTNDTEAIWTFPAGLEMQPNGLFIGLTAGCYCVDVSIGDITADPVGVWVACPLSDPNCANPIDCTTMQACPTPTPTATPT
jgi:hypothetical protein